MKNNTIDEYKKAIKSRYEESKTGVYSGFLENPSPAELKNLCLLFFDTGLNKQDQEVFDLFFELDEKSNKRKQLEHYNVDKLKPIGHFLKGKTETTRAVSLDLIAVLVDCNPRPYRKFITGDRNKLTDVVAKLEIFKESDRREELEIKRPVFEDFKTKNVREKMAVATVLVLVVATLGYGVKNTFFPNKNCMVWVENHYEAANYDSLKNPINAVALNEEVLDNFKKIRVCDTTTFFKNNKPLFWYAKEPTNNDLECFNQPGLHPETGVTLKPITKHMIDKYITKQK